MSHRITMTRVKLLPARTASMLALVAALLAGCGLPAPNPSFLIEADGARSRLDTLQDQPARLERPLVLLGGWIDPGVATGRLRHELGGVFDDERMIEVTFAFMGSFDACRDKTIAAVDQAFPSDDPLWTSEVDVVAVSMGGLVARYAAAPVPGLRRLRIGRLFTISTPHRGADLASMPTLDPLVRDMRPGSDFLVDLDAALATSTYTIIPYVRLGDVIVGPDNAAPGEEVPWWVPNRPLEFAHLNATRDPRIVADIILRLRGEPPYTSEPRSPLP
jgi:pimeloyl-ACP methyl ester carboxylesterase